jgi:hypothetical protein
VLHQNRSTINGVQTFPGVAYGWKQRSFDFIKAFGGLKISGYTLSQSGSSARGLLLSGGTSWVDGRNYTVDPNMPSYIVEAVGTTTSKIFRYYQSGSNWQSNWGYNTNGGAGFTDIDPTQYSNAGTLTPVPTNHFTIQRVFYFPNSATKALFVYYGNAQYANEEDALAAVNTETFSEAPNTAASAIYIGFMLLRYNADFNTPASYTFYTAGLFRGAGAGGGSGGGGGGATSLAGLTDVQLTSPTNGQPLVYNTLATKWINSSALTASLFGTASWANNALTASTADNFIVRSNLTVSGSTTLGDASTDSITLTATTMSIGGGNGILNIDNNTLYVNGSANTVGIGTTTPNAKLDVNGNVIVTGSLTLSGSTTQFLAQDGTRPNPAYAFTNATSSGFRYVPGGGVEFVADGTQALVVYSNSWRFNTSTITLRDSVSGNTVLGFRNTNLTGNTPSNFIRIVGVATGSANNPRIETVSNGTQADISLDLAPLGTGSINLLGPTIVSGSVIITGSLTVTSGSTEFQVLDTGTKIGNTLTDTHTLTGSLNVTGLVRITSGSQSIMGVTTYEPLTVEKQGDLKLGAYTTVNSFSSGGAAIAVGYGNVTASADFVNYYYPGFEMQMVGNVTESQNKIRFNYLKRNSSGIVAASYQELLNIYPDARVTLAPTAVGAIPRLIIGATSSIYNLDVSGSANISNGLTVTGSILAANTANSNTNFIGGLATFQSSIVNNVRILYTNASKPAAGGPTYILAASNYQIPLINADRTTGSSYSPGYEIQEWLGDTETDTRLRINYVRIESDGSYLQDSGHEDLISVFPSGRIRINPIGDRPWGGGGGLYEAGLSIGTNLSASVLEVSGSTRFSNSSVSITGSLTVTGSTTINGSDITTAWTPYTPSWTAASTNPVIGNGTLEGWYKVIGKTCFVRGNIVMGTTTTFGTGEWYISMPFTASHADAILMTANLLDNSSAWYNATMNGARAGFNNRAPMQFQTSSGTANDVNATNPFTWASTDRFLWNGSYEIA